MTTRPLTVEYEIDHKGEWRFRVRGGNYEIMAQGEGYKELRNAKHAVAVMAAGLDGAREKVLSGLASLPRQNSLLDSLPRTTPNALSMTGNSQPSALQGLLAMTNRNAFKP
jgi:uncharacterized protein YegP (UPF0339 family)